MCFSILGRVGADARAVSKIKMTFDRVLTVDLQTVLVLVLLVKLASHFIWKNETEQT